MEAIQTAGIIKPSIWLWLVELQTLRGDVLSNSPSKGVIQTALGDMRLISPSGEERQTTLITER